MFKYLCMETLKQLEKQFEEIKAKRKEAILAAFDGRTQNNIANKAGIAFVKVNRWINGFGGLEEEEINRIGKLIGVSFR